MADRRFESVGEKLRRHRINCSLSQKQVADALSIERSAYTHYESGRSLPTVLTIMKLATIFGVPASELFPDEKANDDMTVANLSDAQSSQSIYSLSKEERALIAKFRVLSPEDKDELLAKITNMSE